MPKLGPYWMLGILLKKWQKNLEYTQDQYAGIKNIAVKGKSFADKPKSGRLTKLTSMAKIEIAKSKRRRGHSSRKLAKN